MSQGLIGFVRKPGYSFTNSISSHPEKGSISFELACSQHGNYMSALQKNGVELVILPALEKCPDAPFVEDTTVILDGLAIVCPNKEKSRQGESSSIHAEIKKYIPIKILPESTFLDGGDVLVTEDKIFVGVSSRTNLQAINALAKFTKKPVIPVKVSLGLHLKTSVTYLGSNTLVIDPSSIETSSLSEFKWIETEKPDRYAANCLGIENIVLMPKGFNKVATKIRKEGFKTLELDMSEFEKANGGITCLSIIFKK
jgi:dimethylargininase